jgi:putative ABC transport system permease protein
MLIFGESLAIALGGGLTGIALTFPVAQAFAEAMGSLFPVFRVSAQTVLLQALCAIAVGAVAAFFPSLRAARVRIADGLRNVV